MRYKLKYRKDSKAFFFEDQTENRDHRILTYKIDIIDAKGRLIETWQHQFWTELIFNESQAGAQENDGDSAMSAHATARQSAHDPRSWTQSCEIIAGL